VGFEQLSTLVLALLDACLSSRDYSSALGALDSGTVYFMERPGKRHGPERVYLESKMKAAPLWQDMHFWRANLGHALSIRAIKRGTIAPPSLGATAPAAAAATSPSSSGALSAADDEFILQWLISAAHSMMSNGVPFAKVEGLCDELARTHKMHAESVQTITSFLTKTKAAMEFWNA